MLLANSRRPPLEHPPGTHWPAPTAAMRSCARMRATSSLSATHKRALVRVYLESGECGCRRVAVVFLHHSTILKKQWRASEDTPPPLSPSARPALASAQQSPRLWPGMFVHSARHAARWRCSRAEGAESRVLRARASSRSVDQRHRIGSRRRPSAAQDLRRPARAGGRVPGRSKQKKIYACVSRYRVGRL